MELSYYHGSSADPLSYSTYWSLLDRQCDEHPDREAVIFYNNEHNYYRKTFGELRDEVWMHAGNLVSHFPKLEKGDCIAVVGSNRPEILLIHLVALRIGLSVLFIPSTLKSGDDIATSLAISNCKGLFIEDTLLTGESFGNIINYSSKMFVVIIGKVPDGYCRNNVYTWQFIFNQNNPSEQNLLEAKKRYQQVDPESHFATYFSSGSTGKPKGILWSQSSLINNMGAAYKKILQHGTSNAKILCDRPISSPAFGFFGVTVIAIYGLSLIAVQTSQTVNSSNPEKLFFIIEKEKVTEIILSGYMMHDFVEARHLIKNRLRSLRSAIVGGQLYNEKLGAFIQEVLPRLNIIQGYGGTEIGIVSVSEQSTAEGYTGKPIDHIELKVISTNGQTAKIGEPGELYCHGSSLMVGYITDDGLNKKRDEHGWYPTDDGALMNHNGEIKLLGRTSEVIKKATILIYPATIENMIAKHPKVEDVQVVGVSDPRLFQEICACVVASDPTLTGEELHQWCAAQFHSNTVAPKYYLMMKRFPRAVSLKIDRKQLISIAEELHGKN